MVGCEVVFIIEKIDVKFGKDVLEVKDLVVKESCGVESVCGFNLIVRVGEIVGIVGVDGNG